MTNSILEILLVHAATFRSRSHEFTGQLSRSISSQDIRSVEYTQLTAALDVADELEADLVSEAVVVAAITMDRVDEPITEVTLSTVLM